MFGNYPEGQEQGWGFQRQDLGPGLITAGLSMLANNDGRMGVAQLIGQGGLDAVEGIMARKKAEAAMRRQNELDERARQQHELAMRQGQLQMDEATRKSELIKRWQAGDQTAYKYLFPEQWAADERQRLADANALARERLKSGGTLPASGSGGVPVRLPMDKKTSDLYATRFNDMQVKANESYTMDASLDSALAALDSGIYTGVGGEFVQKGHELGAAIGLVDPADAAAGEILKKVENELALITRNPEQGMGMPGALSDNDIKFLRSMQAGVTRTPEANRQIIAAMKAVQKRKREVADLAVEYARAHGGLDYGFDKELREWANANPLFETPKQAEVRPSEGPAKRIRYDSSGKRI